MANEKEFTVGNLITIAVTFLDKDQSPIMPLGAVDLKISYPTSEDLVDYETVEMTMDIESDGTVTADWDTEGLGARAGRAFWSARSENPIAKVDDYFDLKANLANLNEPSTS